MINELINIGYLYLEGIIYLTGIAAGVAIDISSKILGKASKNKTYSNYKIACIGKVAVGAGSLLDSCLKPELTKYALLFIAGLASESIITYYYRNKNNAEKLEMN